MKFRNRVGFGLVVGASTVLLAACSMGGSQPAFGPSVSGPATVGSGAGVHPNRVRSWMSPDAKKKDLLYISDAEANVVDVYSYPSDKLKGQLSGFAGVQGLCVDKKGDIWVANSSQETMLEYKHGGTQPIATLDDNGYQPEGCAVNSTTGDLAVAGGAGLEIFAGAKGTPKVYTDSSLTYAAYLGYDNAGNIFVDGQGTTNFVLCELPSGSGSSMETIETTLDTGGLAAGVQWDGKYITVGLDNQGTQSINQLTVSGSAATTVGTTTLSGPKGMGQYLVLTNGKTQGKIVIVPELGSGGVVGYFKYPAGGTATKSITGLQNPLTAAISKAK